MMARFKSIATEAAAEAAPVSFTPSVEAIAAAHGKGADIAGLLAQLHLQLVETRQILSTIVWLTPPDDDRLRSLRSLMRKLCWALGSVDLHDPSPTGSA
jgi:hypothetical protein